MADIFDVVADPTRRQLLGRLLALSHAGGSLGEISVGSLVVELGISQPTVSKHLKTLREHGLVQVREEGQHRYYRLDPAPLDEVAAWVEPFTAEAEPLGGAVIELPRTSATDWRGVALAGRLGRVAADAAHGARSVSDRIARR
jgi:ArsR family transcriptional regulator, arsenate/arsenite/antimonite-responsive transcriptional repressor